MRPRNPAFALLVILGCPAACAAGPIDFSYSVTGNVSPGRYDPGSVTLSLDPAGNVQFPAGGGSIEVGAVALGASPGPQAGDSYTAYTPFEVSVAITDQATGASVALVLPGGAVDAWDYRSWDGRWTNSWHKLDLGDPFEGNTAQTSAEIGFTRYTLSVRPQDDHQVGMYTLSATATNPEPGTLVLGLLALTPLGVWRAWRR